MTYFLKNGVNFTVSAKAALDLHESLPVGTYTVKYNELAGAYYLEAIAGFEIKGKVYGDTQRNADRILATFADRPASTGVMLSGEKGSGKTMLAKMISLDAQIQGIPTIVINQPWCGEVFNVFMQTIDQPVVVVFDEFEKVYSGEDQEKMLTLLDGVYPSKKLFVLTTNDTYRVNQHMRNRPGRIYYRIDYAGLETAFIVEYCEDNLKNTSHIDMICKISSTFSEFNFDILKAMVEEMNRYDEGPLDVMKMLNAKPESGDNASYETVLARVGEAIEAGSWRGNPLAGGLTVEFRTVDSDGDPDWDEVKFSPSDLRKIDAESGALHFVNEKGDSVSLTRVRVKQFDYTAF